MIQHILRLTSIAIIATALTSCTLAFDRPLSARTGQNTLDIYALDEDGDNRISFRGRVLENDRGCEVDGVCALRIEVDGFETIVVYHFGMWPPCENTIAVRQGSEVDEAELVEVYAEIGEGGELTTCSSPELYIHRVSGN